MAIAMSERHAGLLPERYEADDKREDRPQALQRQYLTQFTVLIRIHIEIRIKRVKTEPDNERCYPEAERQAKRSSH